MVWKVEKFHLLLLNLVKLFWRWDLVKRHLLQGGVYAVVHPFIHIHRVHYVLNGLVVLRV